MLRAMPRSDRPCLQQAMTVFGWGFDIGTAVINLMDVVSDILVAMQFASDGHWTWFWLVLASLTISNIVYTMFLVEHSMRENLKWKAWRIFQYPIAFPIAQLAPTLHWLLEHFHPSAQQNRNQATVWEGAAAHVLSTVVEEECDAIAGSTTVMKRLDTALREHLRTHLLFYIETIVESIPQSIIQLLAITFLGQVTPIQVFSMSLSLLSIVSKGYVISYSYTVKMLIFKFFVAAHDIFGLFYVFSTILSRDEAADVIVSDAIHMNIFSYIWFWKTVVVAAAITLALIVVGVSIIVDDLLIHANRPTKENVGIGFGLIGLYFLLFAPVVVAAEGVKCLWCVCWLSGQERTHLFPALSIMYSFVYRGDADERKKFLALNGIKLLSPTAKVYLSVRDVCTATPFEPHDLFWRVYYQPPKCPSNWNLEHWGILGLLIVVTIYTLGQIYSFLFPFINFAANYSRQNLLQRVCFYALSTSLLIILLLSVHAYRYAWFLQETRPYLHYLGKKIKRKGRFVGGLDQVKEWIAAYHVPPQTFVLQSAIPRSVLPTDIVTVIADFTPLANGVDMSGLTIKQCNILKDRMLNPYDSYEEGQLFVTEVQVDDEETMGNRSSSYERTFSDVIAL